MTDDFVIHSCRICSEAQYERLLKENRGNTMITQDSESCSVFKGFVCKILLFYKNELIMKYCVFCLCGRNIHPVSLETQKVIKIR